MPALDPAQYDLRHLHEALQHDVDVLTNIWRMIKDINPEKDGKLKVLKKLLCEDLKGQKVILFTYYRDTARYLYRELAGDKGMR